MSSSRATSQRFQIPLFSCRQPRASSSLVLPMEIPIRGKGSSECRGSSGRNDEGGGESIADYFRHADSKRVFITTSTRSFATDVKHLNHQLRHIDGSRSVAQDARVSEHGLRNHMPAALDLVKANDRRRSARPQESIR